MKGLLLDAQTGKDHIILWIKTHQGTAGYFARFEPHVFVESQDLDDCQNRIGLDCKRILVKDLMSDKLRQVLKAKVKSPSMLGKAVMRIELAGDFMWRIYNADLGAEQIFLYENGLTLLKHVEFDVRGDFIQNIAGCDGENLSLSRSSLEFETSYSPTKDFKCVCKSIKFDDMSIEGDEAYVLSEFLKLYADSDPDILLVHEGDRYALDYLHYRFKKHDISFDFGREADNFAFRHGKTYFSYGHVIRRDPPHYLSGRFHFDTSGFMYRECGVEGILMLSRLTGLPPQKVARLSPGASITNLYVSTAYRMGYPIPYKWNMVEEPKTIRKLLEADRGGFIYDPPPGIYEDVIELDYESLYPNIMVKYNLSPETVLCGCCKGKNRLPYSGYHVCEKRQGIVPQVIKPIIMLRTEYKTLWHCTKEPMYKRMSDALKWILVTSFGYTGYKRSRFARIEVHEAITGCARHILQTAAETSHKRGYEVLHGIVDSLWLRKENQTVEDSKRLIEEITEKTGVPIRVEGIYRWIVFLPSTKNPKAPVPNRYYGVFQNGKSKIRGIQSRRRDSPPIVRRFQKKVLQELSPAKNRKEFHQRMRNTPEILKQAIKEIPEDLEALVIKQRINKREYRANTPQKIIMRQRRKAGIITHPGQTIEYIIRDSKAKNPYHRYSCHKDPMDLRVDIKKYEAILIKSLEDMLIPFKVTEKAIREKMGRTRQTRLNL